MTNIIWQKKTEGFYDEHFLGTHKDSWRIRRLQKWIFRIFENKPKSFIVWLNRKEYSFTSLEEAKDFCENYINKSI